MGGCASPAVKAEGSESSHEMREPARGMKKEHTHCTHFEGRNPGSAFQLSPNSMALNELLSFLEPPFVIRKMAATFPTQGSFEIYATSSVKD